MTDNYVYRRYLYIDTDEVLAYATVMDGGEISDDVHTITRRMGGKIGAKLGPQLIPFNLSIGANVDRFISRRFKVRQTAYVATDKVISGIRKDKIGSEIREGMVIQCDVFLESLRKASDESQKEVEPRTWWERRQEAKDRRIAYAREYSYRQDMIVEALDLKRNGQNATVILALSPQWLLRPDEFSRGATIIGKVIGVQRQGEVATEIGDGTFDFRWDTATEGTAEQSIVAASQQGAVAPGQQGTVAPAQQGNVAPRRQGGRGVWPFRRKNSSRHARNVATHPTQLPEIPKARQPDLSRATIRIAPIVIYK
jgi:hypothetical protein